MKITIIGCGTIGRTILENVSQDGHNITIIDNDVDRIEKLIEKFDVYGVAGNGASMEIQNEANVKNSDLVITVTSSDEINILACLVAKKLGAKNTIARVRNPEYRAQAIMMKDELGLSMIVNPEQESADEIFNIINLPSVNKIEQFAKGRAKLVEITLEENNPLVGETLISMNKKFNTSVLVCAIERNNDILIPTGGDDFRVGDKIHFTSDSLSLNDFLTELKLNKTPLKNIMIIGGGTVGYYLAKALSEKKYKVKLIEHKKSRANELAELLPKCTVVHGDGTNHDLLIEEGIEKMDAFIALTNVDEENIIVSLFADKLGIKKVFAHVKREGLMTIIGNLSNINTFSPKDIAANRIISYIRAIVNKKGSNVLTLYRLVNNQIEALEFLAKRKEKIFDQPLKDLTIKNNCLIACIIRENEVIIPKGNDTIRQNDSVLVVTKHKKFDDLMDIFE